jgi:hypothetical protein
MEFVCTYESLCIKFCIMKSLNVRRVWKLSYDQVGCAMIMELALGASVAI